MYIKIIKLNDFQTRLLFYCKKLDQIKYLATSILQVLLVVSEKIVFYMLVLFDMLVIH